MVFLVFHQFTLTAFSPFVKIDNIFCILLNKEIVNDTYAFASIADYRLFAR